ncbi:MAG: hypothetical protein ABWK04_07995 [Hydrogenobacter sp.]|uniref:hypothetical protein n=1 Tax=Hydrogenobacter thermophilus TaxID=940 RepID=UPI0030FA5C9A
MIYLLVLLILSSCGIKANPEPLPEPLVEIRRLGDNVYVRSLQGNIQVEGFEKLDGWFMKEDKEAFCFIVRRIGGKSGKFCVGKSIQKKPAVILKENDSNLLIEASGFPSYRLYPLSDGKLDILNGAEFRGIYRISRDYFRRCYAITGVLDAVESEPYNFCVEAKKVPPIKDVERLEYQTISDKIYLIWSYTPDDLFKEFVIYKDGKEVGSTQSYMYEDTLPEGKTTYTVKVRNKLGFESSGRSITYSP